MQNANLKKLFFQDLIDECFPKNKIEYNDTLCISYDFGCLLLHLREIYNDVKTAHPDKQSNLSFDKVDDKALDLFESFIETALITISSEDYKLWILDELKHPRYASGYSSARELNFLIKLIKGSSFAISSLPLMMILMMIHMVHRQNITVIIVNHSLNLFISLFF